MKKGWNKWFWIILIIVIILIFAVAGYFILKQNDFNFSFSGFNFGNGLEGIGKTGNVFEDSKLNPFSNSAEQ